MKIPLHIYREKYSEDTVHGWQQVWKAICKMCYEETSIEEEIITRPGFIDIDDAHISDTNNIELTHTLYYNQRYPINEEVITLDYIWKQYSEKAGPGFTPKVVPEFKRLHVPGVLFYTLGVDSWFRHCFPNCKITFWDI